MGIILDCFNPDRKERELDSKSYLKSKNKKKESNHQDYQDEESRKKENQSQSRILYSLHKNKKVIIEANMLIYFMTESYKNCILKFQTLGIALREGDSKKIEFEKKALNVIIDNTSIQFQSCKTQIPPGAGDLLEKILKEFKRDFNQFSESAPSYEEFKNPTSRLLKVLDCHEINYTELPEVKVVNPKHLISSFEKIQASYHSSDEMRARLQKVEEINLPRLNSQWSEYHSKEIL